MLRLEAILAIVLVLGACASTGNSPPSVKSNPSRLSNDGHVNLGLAESYLEQGNLTKATERSEAALRSDPNSAEAHAMRAMVHERQGESEKAGREFDHALKLAPDDGAVLNAHAAWLCGHGQAEQADREFIRALEDDKYRSPIQALANAGKCALSTNRLPQAEDYLRRALVFGPQDKVLLYLLAEVELRQGTVFEAQAFVQRRDALGADAKTLELAARIEDAAGNAMGAARYRQRLHDEFPEAVSTGEGTRSP
jgi:type IV pilus assembly protein PilF